MCTVHCAKFCWLISTTLRSLAVLFSYTILSSPGSFSLSSSFFLLHLTSSRFAFFSLSHRIIWPTLSESKSGLNVNVYDSLIKLLVANQSGKYFITSPSSSSLSTQNILKGSFIFCVCTAPSPPCVQCLPIYIVLLHSHRHRHAVSTQIVLQTHIGFFVALFVNRTWHIYVVSTTMLLIWCDGNSMAIRWHLFSTAQCSISSAQIGSRYICIFFLLIWFLNWNVQKIK